MTVLGSLAAGFAAMMEAIKMRLGMQRDDKIANTAKTAHNAETLKETVTEQTHAQAAADRNRALSDGDIDKRLLDHGAGGGENSK